MMINWNLYILIILIKIKLKVVKNKGNSNLMFIGVSGLLNIIFMIIKIILIV